MALTAALVTFALVVPAELPDKTFVSCVVLGSRERPLPVWAGAAAGLSVQAGIAVAAGRLLAELPRVAVGAVVAALFLGGAAYLLFVPERAEEAAGERLAGRAGGDGSSALKIAATSFGVVALAEFGDVTQVLIANLALRFREPFAVLSGAVAAFVVVSLAGVLAGSSLTRRVPLALVRRLSGLALAGLGAFELVQLATRR